MSDAIELREVVREKYGALAQGLASCCGEGCGCTTQGGLMEQLGYTAEQAARVPEGADLGLGCGNPLAYAAARPGETVLDLGSGAGIDAFLAAAEVGPTGHVIGVDMTPAMLSRARENQRKTGVPNVEFRLGEIEHLPVADASVDLVISNCVINLSTEKPQVFREAHRVLKPGGRMLVSDLVWLKPVPEEVRKNVDAWVGCLAGASLRDDYLQLMRDAGFVDVEVLKENSYTVGEDLAQRVGIEAELYRNIASAKIRAVKR
jgi:arsenite methyltransferase